MPFCPISYVVVLHSLVSQLSIGEIRIPSDTLHIFVRIGNMRVEVADYESGVVEGIKVEEDSFMTMPAPAINIGGLYDTFWEEIL